ncbi:uncharacterized protein DS421_14g476790 [Arachis hypogaea]|nr:uncharacterized protein DS421_14g476790 [Arachis hypogaea]
MHCCWRLWLCLPGIITSASRHRQCWMRLKLPLQLFKSEIEECSKKATIRLTQVNRVAEHLSRHIMKLHEVMSKFKD